jgi:type I restriction enzyme S subunit
MSKRWPTVKLGDVLRRSDETIDLRPDAAYRQITVKLWGRGVVLRGISTGAEIAASRQIVARCGQFILSRIDARNGALGIVPPELDEAIVSNDFPVFNVIENRLLPTYLGWMCHTASFVEECKRSSEGTTNRVRLQEDKFLVREIPLPPLEDQRRVVARIEELAAKIHEARTLRQQAVVEASALVESASRQRFGSPLLEVGEIANVTKLAGFEHTKFLAGAPPGNVVLLRAGNVRNNGLDLSNPATIPAEISDQLPRSQLAPNDVVMTFIGAKIGDVSYVTPQHPRLHCGPNVAKLTPKESINHHYLVAALQAPVVQDQIREITKSTAQPSLSMKTIRTLRLPVPSLSEQLRIVAELNELRAEVDALTHLQTETAAELNALLPAILDHAFNGEI